MKGDLVGHWTLAITILILSASGPGTPETVAQELASCENYPDSLLVTRYKVVMTNGGPDGFFSVTQVSSDDHSPVEHTLTCEGTGYERGEFTPNTIFTEDPPRLLEYARSQIAAGILYGRYSSAAGDLVLRVSWKATQ